MPRYELLQHLVHSYYDLHGLFPDLIDVLSFIISRGEYRNGRRLVASFCIIVDLLIMKIKPEVRLKTIPSGSQEPGFRSRPINGIPVEVDIQDVAPLKKFCSIRIDHRDKPEA